MDWPRLHGYFDYLGCLCLCNWSSTPSLRSSPYPKILATKRRRLRRQRAIARHTWWKFKTGLLPEEQAVPALKWVLTVLSSHHSRDPSQLGIIHRHLKAAMSKKEATPWRCGPCKRMVRETQEYCPGCGGWWEAVCDFQFTLNKRAPSSHQRQSWESWTASEWAPPQQRSRQRSSSANRRAKGKSKGKDKGKGKDKSKEKGKESAQEQAPSPFAMMPTSGTPPALPAPFPSMPSSTSTPPMQLDTSGPSFELAAAIRKAYPDVNHIPSEIREVLEKTDSLAGKQLTQELHRATTALGKAQRSVKELEDGREKHRLQWLSHVRDSLQMWEQQLQEYEVRQQQLSTAIVKAKSDTESAHHQIQVLNARAAGKPPPEPSTAMAPLELGPPPSEEDQEERALRKQLHHLLAKCALHQGVKGVGEKTYRTGEETCRGDRNPLRHRRGRQKTPPFLIALQVIATACADHGPSLAFSLKQGSVPTCPYLVNVRREPRTGLRVGFLCAEAYSWSKSDDQSAARTVDLLKDSQINYAPPEHGLTPLEAIRDACDLRWMVLNETLMDQISVTTMQYLDQALPSTSLQSKDSVCGSATPHVSDLWCEDLTHSVESFNHDALSLQQTSCNLVETKTIGTTWRTWPEANEDLVNILAEDRLQEDIPEPPVVDGPIVFEDIEEWTRLATRVAGHPEPNIVLTVHGLKDIDIGVRRTYLHSLNIDIIEEALHGLWPQFDPLAKKVHIVNPQPFEDDSVVVILEFFDLWNPAHTTLKPILHERLQPEIATIVRSAWYSPQRVTKETFPLDRDDCPTSDHEMLLHVWIRGKPLLPYCTHDVVSGDLVNIRAVANDAIEPWVIGLFPDAVAFKQSIVEQTATTDIEPATWTFIGATTPGSPACIDRFQADWLRFHDPYFVVQMFLEIATYRDLDYDGLTLHAVRPTTGRHITFLFGQIRPDRHLVHVVYSAKWDETWSEQYCYQTTATTVTDFLHFANLAGMELSILHCARLVQGEDLPLQNGDRLELELEEISDSESTENNDTFEEAAMLQSSSHTNELGLLTKSMKGNDVQSHVSDRWCIERQEPSHRQDTAGLSAKAPDTDTCKPNNGIMPDFDAILPFRYRAPNGQLYNGRRHAPPHWDEHPLLQTAGNVGAVYRDGSDELRVRVRTWIASHHTTLILPHRDISMRAQLMHQLESRVRRAWPDQIGDADRTQLTIVQPSPRSGNAGNPKMRILIEINRPPTSRALPILIAHREIDTNGPSDNIYWIPVLAETPIGIDLLHRICAPPCNADQMLVPQVGRTRRWMTRGQTRELTAGLFLPIWWDSRRGTSTAVSTIGEESAYFRPLPRPPLTRGHSRNAGTQQEILLPLRRRTTQLTSCNKPDPRNRRASSHFAS